MPYDSRDIDFEIKTRRLKVPLLFANIAIAVPIWILLWHCGHAAATWAASVLAGASLRPIVLAALAVMLAGACVTWLAIDPPRSDDDGR